MTASDFEKAWTELPAAELGQLSGIRVSGIPLFVPVYVAMDTDRRRQLLVALPQEHQPVRVTTTRGVEVKAGELRVGDSPVRTYIQLICPQPAHFATFSALAASIVAAITADPSDPGAAVIRCMDRWRSFWAVDRSGLSREQALGLFGELWFMLRWMSPLSASRLIRWQGPLGARHDFQWAVASIEAKTTALSGTAVHLINELDQLDAPEIGQLYIFSLHVADDALATNSLPVLVDRMNAALDHDVDGLNLFSERLAKAGYNPADADRYSRPLRILSEELYLVDGSFPKLTLQSFYRGLPSGISNVTYCLDMAACASWRVATAPTEGAARFLHE